jgi:hypothetical protein
MSGKERRNTRPRNNNPGVWRALHKLFDASRLLRVLAMFHLAYTMSKNICAQRQILRHQQGLFCDMY